MKTQKLWLLRPLPRFMDDPTPDSIVGSGGNPWHIWWDTAQGFVVRAESEQQARALAADEADDEGRRAWLDPAFSDCTELVSEGELGVILRDFNAG